MVACADRHPPVYVVAVAIPEDELESLNFPVADLFNAQVLQLAVKGITVIVPTLPPFEIDGEDIIEISIRNNISLNQRFKPTFPKSSPYVTTVTFPVLSDNEKFNGGEDPRTFKSALSCKYTFGCFSHRDSIFAPIFRWWVI